MIGRDGLEIEGTRNLAAEAFDAEMARQKAMLPDEYGSRTPDNADMEAIAQLVTVSNEYRTVTGGDDLLGANERKKIVRTVTAYLDQFRGVGE